MGTTMPEHEMSAHNDPREVVERDSLDWTAFRYVADEMDADERCRFEASLVVDQAAREAVARAVEISQAVVSVMDAAKERRIGVNRLSGAWRRVAMWGGAVSAVAVLWGATIFVPRWFSSQESISAPRVSTAFDRDVTDLAVKWVQTAQAESGHVADAGESGLEGEFSDAESVDATPPREAREGAVAVAAVPSWMLLAVGDLEARESDDAPSRSEVE